MTRLAALGLVLAATTGRADAAPADLAASPFAGMPNIDVAYYDVGGRSVPEIARALRSRALVIPADPQRPGHGGRYLGYTRPSLVWRFAWQRGPQGCRITDVTTRFAVKLILPRLIDEARQSPEVRAHWRLFMRNLLIHEAGHARILFDHIGTVKAAIVAAGCERGNQAAQDLVAGYARMSDAYDVQTRHGATQGAVFR